MSTVKEILDYTLGLAPQDWKEDWDNVGLLCGHADQDVRRCLVALDVTMAVAQEAFNRGAELIVSHHPLLFSTQSLFLPRGIRNWLPLPCWVPDQDGY